MNLQFDINSLIIGVISGIVSSIIIYILVFKIKPKLKISENIARDINDNNDIIYRIKIVNKTGFAIYNLNYSLYYCSKQSDGIINITEINPSKSLLFYISPYKRKDKDDRHAVRITYNIDENIYNLDDNSYLRFSITATHGFTNTASCTEISYNKNNIIDGVFETGNSLKVLSINKNKRLITATTPNTVK